MPIAEMRSSAKDDAFVRYIVELRVFTQMSWFCVLFGIYGVLLQFV